MKPKKYGVYNYLPMKKKLINLYREYIVIDLPEHVAEEVFAEAGVKVQAVKEMKNPKAKYAMRIFRVTKGQEEGFIKCMAALEYQMELRGHKDYASFCKKFNANWADRAEQLRTPMIGKK